MKYFLSLFASLVLASAAVCQPPGNKNAFIELPADQQISSKQRSVKITAKTDGVDLNWIVLNTAPGVAIQWDDVGGKSIRIYPNDVDDEILVICYTTAGTPARATPAVSTAILVIGPAGRAKKDAGEPVEAPVELKRSGKVAAHVSFIVDFQKQTPEIAAIVNDANLRTWIAATGARLHTPIDVKSDVLQRTKAGYAPLINSVNALGGAPCVIVQDIQGNMIGGGRMVSIQGVKDLISPHTK